MCVIIKISRVGLGCKSKANGPHVGHGSMGGMPSVGVFLRDPSDRGSNPASPVFQFERRSAQPLAGHNAGEEKIM